MDAPRRHIAIARAVLVVLATLTFTSPLPGCTRRATQLMLTVATDLAPTDYRCIGIEITRLTDGVAVRPSQWVAFEVPTVTDVPFSLGVLPPGGDPSLRVEIRAEARTECALDPNDPDAMAMRPAPVVRTVLRAGFSPQQTLRLPIFLAARCTGVMCGDNETCDPGSGMCIPVVEQRPEELEPVTPGEELLDAGTTDAPTEPRDTGPRDANLVGGQCPLTGNDDLALSDAAPRVFGLTITRPGREWIVISSDGGAMRATAYQYDDGSQSRRLSSWSVGTNLDAIALEALDGDRLIAVVNPAGSTDLVRWVGPIAGAPTSTSLGTGRLVQNGRHSVVFGNRIATVVERGAGVAIVAIGESDTLQDLYVSTTPVEIALGNTPTGDVVAAISGDDCEIRTFDTSGAMIAMDGATVTGTCAPRAVERLLDGRLAMAYANDTQLRIYLSTSPPAGMTLWLTHAGEGTYVPLVGAILGNDVDFRVAWQDEYDYPAAPEPGPLEPGILYWTAFGPGETISEYTDHGPPGTGYELTRWERLGERSAVVMAARTGFLFRSLCRPTAE